MKNIIFKIKSLLGLEKELKPTEVIEKLNAEQEKQLFLLTLTPDDIPRSLYYKLRDEWYKTFHFEELYKTTQVKLTQEFLPEITIGGFIFLFIVMLIRK